MAFALLSKQNTSTYPFKGNTGFAVAGIFTGGACIYLLSRYGKNLNTAVGLHNEVLKASY